MTRVAFAPPLARDRVAMAVVAIVAGLVHLGTIGHGFVFDDVGIIVRNPLVQEWSGVWRAWGSPWWPDGAGQYRPLVLASFSAEWMLGGGSAMVFHTLNVGWHAAVSVLVFHVARWWLSFLAAGVAALLFAVHPVHVEAVANVVGRSELMAAAGVLAALALHRRRSWWAVFAYACALASKEHALVLLLLVPLVEWSARPPHRDANVPSRPPHPTAWGLGRGYGVVTLAWIGAIGLLFGGSPVTAADPLWRTISLPARWLTMLGVVPTWLRLGVAPWDLSADYSPQVISPWPANGVAVVGGAVILLVVGVATVVAWRRDRRIVLALAWIGITLGPVSNVIVPVGMITAERVLYLPSVAVVLLIGLGFEAVAGGRPRTALGLAMGLGAAFTWRTITRVPTWESNRSVFLTLAREHPESSLGHVLLARVYLSNGGLDDAMREYLLALTIYRGSSLNWIEAATNARRMGDLARADSLLSEARRALGDRADLWSATAALALERGDGAAAQAAALAAQRFDPDASAPLLLLAQAAILQQDLEAARRWIDRVPPHSSVRASADSLLALIDRSTPESARPGR